MSRSCASGGLVVGGDHRLPQDPCEFNPEGSDGPGCNHLLCKNCGAPVRNSGPGLRIKDSSPADPPTMYAVADWSQVPFVTATDPSWRLYACKCDYWEEASAHQVINDHESGGDPHMNWACGGHPAPELPLTLGEFTVSTTTDWPTLVQRILDGACPRRLERADEGPWRWLSWLYRYLDGLPVTAGLSRAVADRIADPRELVVAAVLAFFRRFPTAEGIARIISHASSNPATVVVERAVPGTDYRPRMWDVLIAVLQDPTDEAPARDVVDLMREIMLRPAGDSDPLKETLSNSWESDAFRADDAEWFAAHIVALEAAGPGRWRRLMNLVVAFARGTPDLESLVVIAGVALIQSRRVPDAEFRAWIKQRAYASEAWALVLETSLDKA